MCASGTRSDSQLTVAAGRAAHRSAARRSSTGRSGGPQLGQAWEPGKAAAAAHNEDTGAYARIAASKGRWLDSHRIGRPRRLDKHETRRPGEALAVAENVIRADLSPLEEARA